MSLYFSYGDANWSYSGFHRFRCRLAQDLGIDLEEMEGYKKGGSSWETVSSPLVGLLHHSDCDGELSPEQCRLIAPKLRELINQWPPEEPDRHIAEQLAEGMEAAARDDEPLEFF